MSASRSQKLQTSILLTTSRHVGHDDVMLDVPSRLNPFLGRSCDVHTQAHLREGESLVEVVRWMIIYPKHASATDKRLDEHRSPVKRRKSSKHGLARSWHLCL